MDPKELRGLMEAYAEMYAPIDENRMASRMEKMPSAPAKVGKATHSIKDLAPSKEPTPEEKAKARKALGLGEAVKGASRHDTEMRKAAASERRAGDKHLSPSKGKQNAAKMQRDIDYFDKVTKKTKPSVVGMTHEEYDEDTAQKLSNMKRVMDVEKSSGRTRQADALQKKMNKLRVKNPTNEEFDIFDVVLEFLQAEGYAETLEEAEWLMANVIDEEAIDIILGEASVTDDRVRRNQKAFGSNYTPPRDWDQSANRGKGAVLNAKQKEKQRRKGLRQEEYMDEAQVANRDPEKYEREQSKKSAPVRGERTPMPPRGDKRREDFEKWYAANVR